MNIVKLIFLDFDGVLNNQLWYVATKGQRADPITGQRILDDIDPKSVEHLNILVKNTGAKVVVSSTWRLGRTVEQLQEILVRNGFEGEVIGKTDDLRPRDGGGYILRGNEILKWLETHNEKHFGCDAISYVIFDDDSDMLFWQKDNFIQTDPYCGLTPSDVWRATKILNKPVDI